MLFCGLVKKVFSHTSYLLLLALFLTFEASATRQTVSFFNLTTRDGLVSNITNSIVQDKYGFIWIGTQEGLHRYDGFKMTVFQHDHTENSVSSSNISALLYDDDHIWIGTWDGLNVIDIHTFQIRRIYTGEARVIRALHKDQTGNIWIGTSAGILIHNKEKGEFRHYHTGNSNLSHNTIRSFYQSFSGEMWIGTYDGLNLFRNGQFTSWDLKGSYKPLLENNLILAIAPYARGIDSLLWVGTETGLSLFDTKSGNYTLYNSSNTGLSNEVIKCIYHENDSMLWLGTDFGLNIFNPESLEVETFYHDPLIDHTIASNVVWEIFEDRENRLWLITSNGVSVTDKSRPFFSFHEQYFSMQQPRIGNQVKDIIITETGDIWMATIHGVVRENPADGSRKIFTTTSPPHERILLNNVYALKEDDHGRIWIGTAGGINIWEPETENMISVTANRENGLLSNYISGFASDCDGNLWVTAWEGGLFRIDWDGVNPETMVFRLVDPNGDGRLVAGPGHIFYGSNSALWLIDNETLQKSSVEKVNKVLVNKQISSMISAADGSVWIGTLQELIRYFPSADSLVTLPIHTGRPRKIINLQEDERGNIWATTPDAIIRIKLPDKEQVLIPIDPNSPMKGFYPYCSTISKNGHIFFGGDNGYIKIDPDRVYLEDVAPGVFISGLLVNNQEISPSDTVNFLHKDIAFTDRLRLRHNQNSVTFEFTTLDFLFPEYVQFHYRMIPGNPEWVLTSGEKNFAVFANLKPGDYVFEVKGSDRFGRWSEPKTLSITIVPSLWLSRTFIILYIVLFISGTWYAYRVYRNRRRLRNELQLIKLEKQHSEELYQAKIRFFTNISHEFRTPLSLIIPPLQEMLKGNTGRANQEKLLKLANRNAQRLYKLVNQLLDFRKIEAEKLELAASPIELVSFCREIFNSFDDLAVRNEIDYYFSSKIHEITIEADREKIETIIFNLLSNAFKYTPVNGRIGLEISILQNGESPAQLEIAVTDNGIGISPDEQQHIFEQFYQTAESKSLKKGSGIGLTLAREYARLHGGNINVASEPGAGSTFVFSLPIKEPAINEGALPARNTRKIKRNEIKASEPDLPVTAKKVLVVDDNEDILELIEMNLKDHYHVTLAKNGQEALQVLEKQLPHLVISDVMMPVMDGMELCEKIKENKATTHIPVILLTARSLDMHKTEGISKGADLYITKPFDMDYLKSAIKGVFRREEQMTDYIKTQLLLNPGDQPNSNKNQDELFLKKVIDLIENNIANPELSVELLGSAMGMSATHLYRKLKESTGYSTKEIIMNYRMQKAAQMIANNEGNISEIMYAVGFSSLSGFSRSFKTKFGVAPTVYAEDQAS
jgi:signal transduction histidine kinase/ligand-binding sensor domain-containing protein/DNA-binding response OmpR family regulator